jgi:ribosome biogenesis protein Nip4
MKTLKDFLEVVGANYEPKEKTLLNINNKRFEIEDCLRKLIVKRDRLVYAGRLLGREKQVFVPSPWILEKVASCEGTNKIHVDRETGWLFLCGRDVFEKNFKKVDGELNLGTFFLVLTEGNCLGYGKIETFNNILILRNIYDLGDFLRRERD